jgi:hypothetical protein
MPTLVGLLVLVIYAGGIWKFLGGFRYTNFNDSLPNRLYLAALWPALLLMSKSYRQNFNRALKGG